MPLHVPTFFTRLASAVIFSAIMLAALLGNTWGFILLFLVVNILCLREYAQIVSILSNSEIKTNQVVNLVAVGSTVFIYISTLPMSACYNSFVNILQPYSFHVLGLMVGTLLVFFLFKNKRNSMQLLTGVGYISISLGLLVQLRYQSILLPIVLILLIWMNDTMAYLTGSFIGKTPFFPGISPKKTLEGTLGGIVFCMAFSVIWGYNTSWFPLSFWILIGLVASIIGTLGDLAESKLKRMAGLKDSGTMMPGHGGALDRFDSLLLAAPVAFILALVYNICLDMKIF